MATSDDQGVVFPLVGGRRSSQATARDVFVAAAAAAAPGLAAEIEREPDWRGHYVRHVRALTAGAATDAAAARAVAAAGLAALHRSFAFRRDGAEVPLADAWQLPGPDLHTAPIRGDRPHPGALEIPYGAERLTGDVLARQLDAWVTAGVVEPSCADAVRLVAANPDWLDLSDLRFALLGAGSEMGPLAALARWGATVFAVDVPNAAVTSRLVAAARHGCGRVFLPTSVSVTGDDEIARAAGVDLLTALPEVGRWLAAAEGPLVVGNYVYAAGATFTRLAMAVDAIVGELTERRADVSLAYLATPTDVFAVPEECVLAARQRLAATGHPLRLGRSALHGLSAGRLYRPNYAETLRTDDGRTIGIADSLVVQQGPNYALAKRLQRWRAVVARDAGVVTSANVAPATRTRSVVSNRLLRAAYAGAHRYGVEVFEPATSRALMAALLVHDLRNGSAVANPATPLHNPTELFMAGAAHGGLWRVAFEPRSVLGIAALTGLPAAARSRAG